MSADTSRYGDSRVTSPRIDAPPPRSRAAGRGRREGEANAQSRDCYVDCRRDWICRRAGGLSRAGQQRGAETSRDREQSHHSRSALALGQPMAASLPWSAQPLVVVLIIASGMSFGPGRETPGPLLSGCASCADRTFAVHPPFIKSRLSIAMARRLQSILRCTAKIAALETSAKPNG